MPQPPPPPPPQMPSAEIDPSSTTNGTYRGDLSGGGGGEECSSGPVGPRSDFGAEAAFVVAVNDGNGGGGGSGNFPKIKEIDFLVQEIKENLKLGTFSSASTSSGAASGEAPPDCSSSSSSGLPTCAVGPAATLYPQHGMRAGGGAQRLKARSSNLRMSRSSPYVVPWMCGGGGSGEGAGEDVAGGQDHGQQEGLLGRMTPRRCWAAAARRRRRRYPSTCMSAGGGGNGSVAKSWKRDLNVNNVGSDEEDPLAILQELISGGSLIKEAVRRLQSGFVVGSCPEVGSPPFNNGRHRQQLQQHQHQPAAKLQAGFSPRPHHYHQQLLQPRSRGSGVGSAPRFSYDSDADDGFEEDCLGGGGGGGIEVTNNGNPAMAALPVGVAAASPTGEMDITATYAVRHQ